MNFKSHMFILIALLCSTISFAYDCNKQLADELFDKRQYSLAKSYYIELKSCDEISKNQSEMIDYKIAFCALELFNKDAEYLLLKFIKDYSSSFLINDANYQLTRLYFMNKEYSRVIARSSLVDVNQLNDTQKTTFYFRQAYANFVEEQYDQSKLAFYEIRDADFRFKELVKYFPAHIAYLEGNYATALKGFQQLSGVNSLGKIASYYIAQIYYFQKRFDDLLEYAIPLVDSVEHTRNNELNRLIADAYYFKNDYKKAIEYLNNYKESFGLSRLEKYQLAYSHSKLLQYDQAIAYFDEILDVKDSLSQFASYHLGECYVRINKKNYGANAFKYCSSLDYDLSLKEDAFFNYVKLTVENKGSYNNAIDVIKDYLQAFPESQNKDEVEGFLLNAYSSSRNYPSAIKFLQSLESLNYEQQFMLQRVSFFNGINLFNDKKYERAITSFALSISNDVGGDFSSLANYWKAESYYNLHKYEEAILAYKKFIFNPSSISTNKYNDGYYGLAYSNFKLNNYKEAIRWFRKFVDNDKILDDKKADSFFRIADSYFLSKDYQRSIEFYALAQSENIFDIDYAIFQQVICHGLLSQNDLQVSLLKILVNEYSESPYHDDALFILAEETDQDFDYRIELFDRLLNDHPSSILVKSTLLKLGLHYYNTDNNIKALEFFRKVIENYPSTIEAKEALTAYKNISIEEGNVKDYLSFVDGLSNFNVSKSAQDSITFEAAESLFFNQDFDASISSLSDYLNNFSQPIFKNTAQFYLAESLYNLNKISESLDQYLQLNDLKDSRYQERVLSQISSIEFNEKQYGIAALHFSELIEIAQDKEVIRSATISLFECNKKLELKDEIIRLSKVILKMDKVDEQLLLEVRLILADDLFSQTEYYAAKKEYTSISQSTKNSFGAKAKYQLALLSFIAEDYQSVEAIVFDLSENFNNNYFIAKGFVLLSDLYVEQQNYFQAIATLESIIENYDENDDVRQDAIEKLSNVRALESKKAEIKETSLIIDLLNDIEFEEEENLYKDEE
ncbi:MAG: tetratricopeptide repeat protein [Flavobacteriales bacterium]